MKSISLWHKFSVISVMILCQPCWIQLIYHRKSLRSKLIRDVSKASSTVIEEWWINVHAFDLAGLVLSNRFPFSRSVPFPTMASFSYSLSLRSILFSFCISYCYYNHFECHVEFTLSSTPTCRHLFCYFLHTKFVIREKIFHAIFFTFLPVITFTREKFLLLLFLQPIFD